MSKDLTGFLSDWEYDPEQTMRIIEADDGRNVLQVRLPLGIEQYELDGRPDGERPNGYDSALAEVEYRLEAHQRSGGSAEGFEIDHDEAVKLQNEGVLFYQRYLLLFQMSDFGRVARDTEHNLRLCRLLEEHCGSEEDRNAVLQFRPYIIRMNAMSRAMISLNDNLNEVAQHILESATEEIEELPELEAPAFQFERIRSLNYLRSATKQLTNVKPSPVAKLQRELKDAVAQEDYERAAELRDRIRDLS